MTELRIATRKSPLALWQAEHVKARLQALHPQLAITLVPITTQGDKLLNQPLAKIGGKGLFVKELENAMLDGRADLAVHSMKDVPVEFPAGLGLAVICERETPFDAFVSNTFASIDQLPTGAVVGTSSQRRQCQLKARRPDLVIRDLRGNVNTRLAKLDAGEYDAIILAAAGLIRLEMTDRIRALLTPEESLPANGQGAIGVECRTDDRETRALLAPLEHPTTRACVLAERAMNRTLQGGCQVPIGAYATIASDILHLDGLVGSLDGKTIIRRTISGPVDQAEQLGQTLAQTLLSLGADQILRDVYSA